MPKGPFPRRVIRIARAFAERLLEGDAPPPADRLDRLMDDFQLYLVAAGPKTRLALRAGLLAVQWVPPPRFTSLDPPAQRRRLEKMESSTTLGMAFVGLKIVLAILWFGEPGAPGLPPETRIAREPTP